VDAEVRNPLDKATRAHRSDVHEMSLLLTSGYDATVAGKTYRGEPGDVFVYPRGVPHLPTPRDTSLRVYCLQWMDEREGYAPDRALRVKDTRGRILTLLEWLWENHTHPRDAGRAVEQSILSLILAEHRRLSLQTEVTLAERVTNYFEQHLHEPVTLGEVAGAMGISVPLLIRRFRGETGETPIKRLQRLRVQQAVALLRGTREPFKVVASRVGISSLAHLSLLLRRCAGRTPGELRHGRTGHARR
jgi:AraC-like DNA-binding protein